VPSYRRTIASSFLTDKIMLRKMYFIPADRLHGSTFMSREPTVSKLKHHNPYAEAIKIRKHHPYEEWLKLRRRMDEADLRKKTETNSFAEFLGRLIPKGQASKFPLLLRLRTKRYAVQQRQS